MLLEIRNLVVKYGKIIALHGISLNVKEGELTTFIGANGAGKTTLLKTISGLIKSFSGEIKFFDKRIDHQLPELIVKSGISQCPEGRKVFPRQTVYENLKIGAYIRKDDQVEDDIEKFLKQFPQLKERRNHLAGHLSGGEQQMLVICRALMSRPKLLLLDEPSMGLAPFIIRDVFKMIKRISEEGINILLVEQNAKQALKIADKGYVLEVGQIIAEDTTQNLLASKDIQRSYLGG
jgi:branched-chain amino acid transport system ATP-binding protein